MSENGSQLRVTMLSYSTEKKGLGMTISKLKGEKHEKNNEEDAGSLDSLHHHVR